MKKELVLNCLSSVCLTLLLIVLSLGKGQAQVTPSYSPSDPQRMIIRFEPGTSSSYINAYRASIGASEVAISPVSQVRLWYISNFATAYANHGWTNINETTNGSKEKANVNSVGLVFETLMPSAGGGFSPPLGWNPLGACPNNYSIFCNTSSKGIKIAVMDTGIGYTGTNNGPVFCNQQLFSPYYSSDIGYDFVNHDDFPQDDQGHGTHITGIIAQMLTLSNASNAKILSYKTHDSNGHGNLFDIIMAVDQAVLDGVNIINMSFSYQGPIPSDKPEPLQQAINIAGEYGILVVAAAGNITGAAGTGQGSPAFYPASFDCPNIISVASSNCAGQLSSFSAWGFTNVDIAMLGENIAGPHFITGNLVLKSGTSQAAAIVSGIAAQIASHQDVADYGPLSCSILSGSEYRQALDGLIATSGVAHAPLALFVFQSGCMNPGGTGADFNLSAAPTLYVPQPINETLNAYPNPFNHEVVVNFEGALSGETAVFSVYNAMGALVYAEKSLVQDQGNAIFTWRPDPDNLPGIYFAKVRTNGKTFTQKLIRK